jgi:uncharacterized protein (TIGR03435 family)
VGKNGPKLVEAQPDAPLTAESATPITPGYGPSSIQISADASNLMISGEPTGPIRVSAGSAGTMRLEARKATMTALTDMLSRILDRQVVDMTGLKGFYQLTLNLSQQDMHAMVQAAGVMPPGPGMGGGGALHRTEPDASGSTGISDLPGTSVFQNIQELGLQLEARKAPIVTIVIDHLETVPTQN